MIIDVKPDKYDRVIFTADTPEKDPCKTGGESWVLQLNLLNGGEPAIDVFDVNENNAFNSDDRVDGKIAVGLRLHVGISSEMMSVYNPKKGELVIVIGGSDVGGNVDKNQDGLISAEESAADIDKDNEIDPQNIKTPTAKARPPELIYWQQVL
jgi:Tfp pilus tip-associated adhesin PilY1